MGESGAQSVLDNDYCFACGQQNPFGLHLRFEPEPDGIVAYFTPGPHLQGFAGVLHGGIAATVLDDVMNNLVSRTRAELAVTATLEVRLRRPVPVGEALECRARLTEERGKFFRAEGEIRLAGSPDVLVDGKCLMVKVER
jgi:acyl-coenzyme A thioesterase PaaI-like protein